MAKKFKDYYDTECAELLANKLKAAWPRFKQEPFILFIADRLKGREFSERQDLFVEAFEIHLTGSYDTDIDLFFKILGPELHTTTGMFTHGWWLWPVGRYVEKHGVENPELSLKFIYELTKRFTGEFAIRPLIEADPKATMKTLLAWSRDSNVHVRRLASEGMRIRLPWAKKSLAAVGEFELFSQVLSNLKNDKEKFVQKSVGNNLNDLMKEDRSLAKKIMSEWEQDNPTKETLWIIRHGSRSEKKVSAHV